MKTATRIGLLALSTTLVSLPAPGATQRGFSLAVLVDGAERPEYAGRGTVYVEALRGREYALRITNPLPVRVAVALSVDGLNTIDASHGAAAAAPRWVLGPYESMVISGWQVNDAAARRFVFTGEKRSYGALLGQTENLGVLEAIFFRERPRLVERPKPWAGRLDGSAKDAPASGAAPEKSRAECAAPPSPALSDEYAATGMGERTRHEVERVAIDLEREPAAAVRIRYEFHPQLVALGVLPREPLRLERRERSSGFSDSYCPEPGRPW